MWNSRVIKKIKLVLKITRKAKVKGEYNKWATLHVDLKHQKAICEILSFE